VVVVAVVAVAVFVLEAEPAIVDRLVNGPAGPGNDGGGGDESDEDVHLFDGADDDGGEADGEGVSSGVAVLSYA